MENLGWGLMMMLYGMGTVFLLLGILMVILLLIGVMDKKTMQKANKTAELEAAKAAELEVSKVAPAIAADEVDMPLAETTTVAPGLEILHDGLTRDQIAAISVAVITHARVRRAQAAPAMRIYQPGSHLYASRWVTAGRGQQNTSWRRN